MTKIFQKKIPIQLLWFGDMKLVNYCELNAELYTETEYAIEKECSKINKTKKEKMKNILKMFANISLGIKKNPSHVVLA